MTKASTIRQKRAWKQFLPPPLRNDGKKIERVMRIELTYPAWKAGVLPLNYTRIISDTSSIISQFQSRCKYFLNFFKIFFRLLFRPAMPPVSPLLNFDFRLSSLYNVQRAFSPEKSSALHYQEKELSLWAEEQRKKDSKK